VNEAELVKVGEPSESERNLPGEKGGRRRLVEAFWAATLSKEVLVRSLGNL
jgi:hypothetical protein